MAGAQAPRLIDRAVTRQDFRERRITFDQAGAGRSADPRASPWTGRPDPPPTGPGALAAGLADPGGPGAAAARPGSGRRCRPAPGAREPTGPWTSSHDCSGRTTTRPVSCRGPSTPALVLAHRRYAEILIGRSDLVWEALAPACLEQVVTGKEAFRAFRLLVTEFGELAPGPAADPESAAYGMRVPPAAEVWARIPTWRFLAAGVEQRRSATLVRAAGRARALERTLAGRERGRGPGPAESARHRTVDLGGGQAAGPRGRRRLEHPRLPRGQGHHVRAGRGAARRRRLPGDPGALPRPPVPGAAAAVAVRARGDRGGRRG